MAYFIFIATGFVLAACSWLRPRSAAFCGAALLAYAVLFAGLRGASMDYDGYVSMYQSMAAAGMELGQRLHEGKDPLFGLLIVLIQWFGLNVQWLFVAAAFVALALKARAFRRVFGSIVTPLFVMVCLSYFLHEFTQIRVAIALGFSFLALVELCEGRRVRWLIYSLFAAGFHISALVPMAFELPMAFGMRPNVWMAATALCGLLYTAYARDFLSLVAGIDSRVSIYEEAGNVTNHMMIVAPLKLAGLSMLTLLLVRGGVGDVEERVLKLSCLFAYVGYGFLLIFMNDASGLGFRIYELFDAFSVFILADALLRRRLLSWGMAMGYCAALLLLLANSKVLLPYAFSDVALW